MHSPEPGRGISLGFSQIPRICVLRKKHTGLTAAPARRPAPRTPALLPLGPAHAPGLLERPGGPGPRGPGSSRARSGRPGACGQPPLGARTGRPEPQGKHPPRPAQPGAARSGEGAPRRPRPHGRASGRALTQRVVLPNIHFMAAAKKGRSRLSEPRSSANRSPWPTSMAAAVTTRQADFRAAGA